MKLIATLSALLIAPTAFANMSKTNPAGGSAAKAMTPVHKTVQVEFTKGGKVLTPASKTALRNAVMNAGAADVERDVTIAAWSDKAFPSGGVRLERIDRSLADDRIDVIEDYLEEMNNIDIVDTFNMARHSGYIANMFDTREAEVKGGGNAAQEMDNEVRMLRKEIQSNGGPSKAVVVVTLDK